MYQVRLKIRLTPEHRDQEQTAGEERQRLGTCIIQELQKGLYKMNSHNYLWPQVTSEGPRDQSALQSKVSVRMPTAVNTTVNAFLTTSHLRGALAALERKQEFPGACVFQEDLSWSRRDHPSHQPSWDIFSGQNDQQGLFCQCDGTIASSHRWQIYPVLVPIHYVLWSKKRTIFLWHGLLILQPRFPEKAQTLEFDDNLEVRIMLVQKHVCVPIKHVNVY